MSLFGAWRLAAPAGEVERRLAAALVADRRARRFRELASRLAAATVIFFFVAIFAWLLSGSVLPFPERTVGRVMVIGSATGLLGALLLALATVGRTVDARKVTTALVLVRALKADMGGGARLQLELDLRGYERGRRLAKTGTVFTRRRTAVWRQDWLSVQGELADGTGLELSLADRVKWKQKGKRGGPKIWDRLTPAAELRLRLPKVYGPASGALARLDPEAAPFTVRAATASARRLVVRIALPTTSRFRHRNFVSGRLGTPDEGRWLLMLLRWTYAALAPR